MGWTRGHVIGHGSSATVSLATFTNQNHSSSSSSIFAVKSTELSKSEVLQREQKILCTLNSQYVMGYKGYDITRENNKFMYNLLLDYAPNGTITDQIQSRGGKLDESTIRLYTKQILLGLDYLHSNGIVHCDVKCRNILVTQSGTTIKVADFGCAKRVNEEAGRISGTPAFMAPEVARGEEQGFSSDIWALGCTIIEMATGRPSRWANCNDPISVMFRIAYCGQVPEYSDILSEETRDFLEKCFRSEPEERWTASNLLMHPFMDIEACCNSNCCSSPTSVLEQGVWNSVGAESGSVENMVRTSGKDCGYERIKRLSLVSCGSMWRDDGHWISVRW